MRIITIGLLFIAHVGYAQFSINDLPAVTQEQLLVTQHPSDPTLEAEILIDNQYLSLKGKKIEELNLTNKRVFRLKVYTLIAYDLGKMSSEKNSKLKAVVYEIGKNNEGTPEVQKRKIYIGQANLLNLAELGAQFGDIIDISYETVAESGGYAWKLSSDYPTKEAFHLIDFPEVCVVERTNNYPELKYESQEGPLVPYFQAGGRPVRYKKNVFSAKLTDVSPTDQALSTLIYKGLNRSLLKHTNPDKFGEVSITDMEMTVYEHDSSANAVILYDRGKFDADDFMFTRHVRVKVLDKAGLSWGDWVFNTPSQGNFKVFVFNKNGDAIVKEKIERSSIYREEVIDGFFVYKVFAPNVKVGSIIDIEYSHPGFPYEWRFQHLIPVRHSELEIEDVRFKMVKKTYFGFEPIETLNTNHWRVNNMPAFQLEPHLNHYSNYITKFEFQFSSIYNTWEKISGLLSNYLYFGQTMKSMSFLNTKAKEIKASNLNELEKIDAAYNYIRENIKWNQVNSLVASRGYRSNFEKNHSGNSADINLMLIGLLNKIGITTYPVVLSTRDNGLLREFTTSINKLNYVVGYIENGTTKMLLDATSDNLKPGILPEKCLNGKGWLINDNTGTWIDLVGAHKKKVKQYVQIALNEDGFFEAKVNETKYDYTYLDWVKVREQHHEEGAYLSHLRTVYPDLELLDYKVKKINAEKLNVAEVVTIDMSNNVDDLGDEFIINPYLLTKIVNNPFKLASRKYPLDLSSPIEESATIVLQIPDGYQVKTIPASVKLTGSDDVSFTFLSQQTNGYLNISYKLQVNKSVFVDSEYAVFRQFHSQIVNKLNESIYLQKKI